MKEKEKLKIPHSHYPPETLYRQNSVHPDFLLHLGEPPQIIKSFKITCLEEGGYCLYW